MMPSTTQGVWDRSTNAAEAGGLGGGSGSEKKRAFEMAEPPYAWVRQGSQGAYGHFSLRTGKRLYN